MHFVVPCKIICRHDRAWSDMKEELAAVSLVSKQNRNAPVETAGALPLADEVSSWKICM